jgi:hypothetical protein
MFCKWYSMGLVDLGGSRGAAGRSCALPSKPEAGYLKDEIAFGVIRLVDVRTEAPPSFRSLFLEILQDINFFPLADVSYKTG